MKKIIALILTVVMCMSISSAFAANFCPNCGEKTQQEWNACPRCGYLLNVNSDSVTADSAEKTNNNDFILQFHDYVEFGHYPQTRSGQDNSPIKWQVMEVDIKQGRALLLSCYGLETIAYNASGKNPAWKDSTLRAWLNEEFLNYAFTAEEQQKILKTHIDNSGNQNAPGQWEEYGSEDTEDYIFVLSYKEADKYFNVNHYDKHQYNTRMPLTEYVLNKNAYNRKGQYYTENGEISGCWPLRSMANTTDSIWTVYTGGQVGANKVNKTGICVRPALWVKTDSGELSVSTTDAIIETPEVLNATSEEIYSSENVHIDELGVTVSIPSEMYWATRTKGYIEGVASVLQMDSTSFPSYMESVNEYLSVADPDSNFRFTLERFLADISVRNSILQSDDEFFDWGDDNDTMNMLMSIGMITDKWVWRNDQYAFGCMLMELGGNGQFLLEAITVVDGYFYCLAFRDTDEQNLRITAGNILQSFMTNTNVDNEVLSFERSRISVPIPDNWIISDQVPQEISSDECDQAFIVSRASDGTTRHIIIEILDAAAEYWKNPTTVQRKLFETLYADMLVPAMLTGGGFDKGTTSVMYGDNKFTTAVNSSNSKNGALVCVANGYLIYIVWATPEADALQDECLFDIKIFTDAVADALKEV